MLKRKFFTMAIAAAMTIITSITALAGGGSWQKDETGWWYDNGDGTKATTGWYWLDGNQDGVSECYFFDGKGYLMTNVTTADGFFVNSDGAWAVNGVVQTRSAVPASVENKDSGTATGNAQLTIDNGGYNNYGCSITVLEMINSSREENAKYVEVEVDEAAQSLLEYGWTWGTTGKYAYSNGNTCHAKVNDEGHTIEWNNNYRIYLR